MQIFRSMTTMLFAKYKTGWKFIDDNSGFAACKCCIILGLFFRPSSSGLCFSHSPNWHLENDNQRTSYLYSRRRRKKFMIGIVECCVLLFCPLLLLWRRREYSVNERTHVPLQVKNALQYLGFRMVPNVIFLEMYPIMYLNKECNISL